MNDWTAGYVADIGYTFGYYAELNPQRMKLPLLHAGLVAPDVRVACELGFGQGLSTNIHASAARVEWHGTDFNPSQAGFAQELAGVAGTTAKLQDDAFADFCVRPDLPDFDFIGLHGIWSWISNANREVIVDFVRRKLKVGGVLYISYNTMPGWAPMVPVRALLTEHAEVMGASGQGIVGRIDAALAFAQKLMATNPAYARANPKVVDRINQINGQNRNYVAHEYFNQDWLPMSFADMARWLAPAKLDYACSAHYLDHIDEVNLSQDQRALLADIHDAIFRETVRDFMVGQQFRRDYWVKGARRMTGFERIEKMRAQKVVLTSGASEITFKAVGAAGEAQLTENVYKPLIDLLADHRPRTMHQIEQALKDKNIQFAQLAQALLVLAGKGDLTTISQDDRQIASARAHTDRLNAYLINRARGSGDINYLASPLTGGAVSVPRFHQLFIIAHAQGKRTPEALAAFGWQVLVAQGQRMVKDGKTLGEEAETLTELTEQATAFLNVRFNVLKALGVVG